MLWWTLLQLKRQLKSSDKLTAVQKLGEIKDARAVKLLIAILRGSDWRMKEEAENALVRCGDVAVKPLVNALNDFHTRGAAGEALIRIGIIAVEPLVLALGNEDKYVRRSIRKTLMRIDPNWAESEGAKTASAILRNKSLGENIPLDLHLAYFSIRERELPSKIPSSFIEKLVGAVATEINRLYSQTRDQGQFDNLGTWNSYLVPASDIDGIRELIAFMPESLHARVRELSGEAKYLFDEQPSEGGKSQH